MSKSSIASRTLATAKRKEAERFKADKEKLLEIMQKEFDKRIKSCRPWTAFGTNMYYIHETKLFEGLSDIKALGNALGFNISINRPFYDGYAISIPKWVKGQKKTPAQLMVYWSNIEINRTIKSRKEAAKRMCKEAFEKLENEDFEVLSTGTNYYIITVKVNFSADANTKEFKDEVKRIFTKKKFELSSLDIESGKLNLYIVKN